MAQPSFPYLNRKVKCSFPWYRNIEEVTRNTIQCKAESEGCVPFKQWTPRTNLPPFQIFATEASQYGLATPQTWGIYDLDGNLVVDLAANLGLIQVVQFSSPSREYLVYTGSILSTYLPYGIYESRISIEAGRVFYSETFEVICDGIDVAPCATISGFRPNDSPVIGEFYVDVAAHTYREYLGPDAGVPETEDFYSPAYQCPSLLVNGTGSFPASYWNGSSWQPLTIIEDEVANCFLRLKWTSCGNVGTIYYQDGFQNVLYLDPHTFVVRQSPELKLDNDEGGKGQQNTTFTRKEVKYSLDLGQIPWYLLDALTEIPLVDTVTLQSANGTDPIHEIDVSYTWAEDNTCLALASISFQLDDASTNGSCCEVWDPPCLAPCAVVSGTTDTTPLVDNAYYVMAGANSYVRYVGGGFTAPVACSGLVEGTRGFPDSYWTGSSWEPVAQISVEPSGDDFYVTAVIFPRYNGTLQYSTDGTTWTDLAGPYDAEDWAAGVTLTIPEGAAFIRMAVVFGTCVIGYSEINTAAFVCDEPGTINIVTTTDFVIRLASSTGHYAAKKAGGTLTVYAMSTYPTTSAGEYCVWSSDDAGVISGTGTVFYAGGDGLGVTTANFNNVPGIEAISLDYTEIASIDFSANVTTRTIALEYITVLSSVDLTNNIGLESFSINNNPDLQDILVSSLPVCAVANAYNCALMQTCVDSLLVAFAANGLAVNVDLTGGTNAAPSATGLAAKVIIEGNGGAVYVN